MKTIKKTLRKVALVVVAINVFTATLQAQVSSNESTASGKPTREMLSAGFGIGHDYAGIGVGINIYPHKNFGVLFNGGVFAAGPSYKVGLIARHITNSKVDPYVSLLYGYSGSVSVLDEDGEIMDQYNKIFIKPNIGAGVDIHFTKTICLTTGISTNSALAEMRDYKEKLENEIGADFSNNITLPVGFSFGIRWTIR